MILLFGCTPKEPPGSIFYSKVKSVNKLVLAQMTVSKMASVDDLKFEDAQGLRQQLAALGDALKIGDRKAAYSYDTYLRAYIDLSSLRPVDITADDKKKILNIVLPQIQTEFIGRDIAIREDHYRVTGLRSAINADERARLKEEINTALVKEVTGSPELKEKITARARAQAQRFFGAIAARQGYGVNISYR